MTNESRDAHDHSRRAKTVRRRRPRALQACDVCRIRKNRCSEDRPCTYCLERDLECTYARAAPGLREHQRSRPRSDQWDTWENSVSRASRASSNHEATALDANNQIPGQELPVSKGPGADVGVRHIIGARQSVLQSTAISNTAQVNPMDPGTGDTASDVLDTNLHTNNIEFYGSASSVAFLRHVEILSNNQISGSATGVSELSLTSRLHNSDFRPSTSPRTPEVLRDAASSTERFQFRVARRFLDAYFSNIHYIQPLLNEETFLARCEDLWFGRANVQSISFLALYYATLSLGSLVMTMDEPKFAGADRFEWSRKFFNESLAIVTQLGTATDLEMVQCFYMLSKVCQHELNPHVAYIYSGQAARTALAIGLNRRPVNSNAVDQDYAIAASQTWWAVYCLDIQTSFALGRPDSLGPDDYHTQHYPTSLTHNHGPIDLLQIVPCMISLSRIMRQAAIELYTGPNDLNQKLQKAKALDDQLQYWHANIPPYLWPEDEDAFDASLKPKRSVGFAKKQSVVLRLRYYNLRMVIHAIFMIDPGEAKAEQNAELLQARCRCIQAAEDAIDLMHSTFRTDSFFQSWWFNCTYTLHAVSVLLALVCRRLARTATALQQLFTHIDRAIAVLQAMDDCLVARNAATIIKKTLARAKKLDQPRLSQSFQQQTPQIGNYMASPRSMDNAVLNDTLPPLDTSTGDITIEDADLDWLNAYPIDTSNQALFWTEWANELDILGT